MVKISGNTTKKTKNKKDICIRASIIFVMPVQHHHFNLHTNEHGGQVSMVVQFNASCWLVPSLKIVQVYSVNSFLRWLHWQLDDNRLLNLKFKDFLKISHLVGHIAVVLPCVMAWKMKRLVVSLVYPKCLALIMFLGAASTKKKKKSQDGHQKT